MPYKALKPILSNQGRLNPGELLGDAVPVDQIPSLLAIAAIAETEAVPELVVASQTVDPPVEEDLSHLINLNTATEEELTTLPNVGAVTAQKLIAGRPYASLDDAAKAAAMKASQWVELLSLVAV